MTDVRGETERQVRLHAVETLGPKMLSISVHKIQYGTFGWIKNLLTQQLQRSREIATALENLIQSLRIADVKPILARRYKREVIANFKMNPTLVIKDPSTDTESRQVSLAEYRLDKWCEDVSEE